MQQRSNKRLVLLVAATAILLTSCGGKEAVAPVDVEKQAFEDLRAEVREAIEDPARQAQVLAVVDALSADLATLRESISRRNSQVRLLNADYDTPRAEFESFLDHIYSEVKSNQQRVTASHRELLSATTAEEWTQLSKARSKAMYAAINTIQAD